MCACTIEGSVQNRLTTSDSYSAESGGDQYKDKEATILKILHGSSFVFHSSKTQLNLIVLNVLIISVGDIFILTDYFQEMFLCLFFIAINFNKVEIIMISFLVPHTSMYIGMNIFLERIKDQNVQMLPFPFTVCH